MSEGAENKPRPSWALGIPHEGMANGVLALNAFLWGILGLATGSSEVRWAAVRVSISVIHFTVAWLFLNRANLVRAGSFRDIAWALPSIVLSGLAFHGAPPPERWTNGPAGLFVAATVVVVTSLLVLGRNFAILPAVRGITIHGTFRWVRHPVFAGELLLLLACVLAATNGQTVSAFVISIPMIVIRILVEERLLSTQAEYQDYCRGTRWRLIPFVW